MNNLDKVNSSVYLDKDVVEHTRKNPYLKSFSVWICERYRDEFMNLEQEILHLEKLYKRIELSKERIKQLQILKEEMLISQRAFSWIKINGVVRVRHFQPESVVRSFNDKFNAKLTLKQFMIYVGKAEEELTKGSIISLDQQTKLDKQKKSKKVSPPRHSPSSKKGAKKK